jgi:hypothetical protein
MIQVGVNVWESNSRCDSGGSVGEPHLGPTSPGGTRNGFEFTKRMKRIPVRRGNLEKICSQRFGEWENFEVKRIHLT